jgi:hypothetical protein
MGDLLQFVWKVWIFKLFLLTLDIVDLLVAKRKKKKKKRKTIKRGPQVAHIIMILCWLLILVIDPSLFSFGI